MKTSHDNFLSFQNWPTLVLIVIFVAMVGFLCFAAFQLFSRGVRMPRSVSELRRAVNASDVERQEALARNYRRVMLVLFLTFIGVAILVSAWNTWFAAKP